MGNGGMERGSANCGRVVKKKKQKQDGTRHDNSITRVEQSDERTEKHNKTKV